MIECQAQWVSGPDSSFCFWWCLPHIGMFWWKNVRKGNFLMHYGVGAVLVGTNWAFDKNQYGLSRVVFYTQESKIWVWPMCFHSKLGEKTWSVTKVVFTVALWWWWVLGRNGRLAEIDTRTLLPGCCADTSLLQFGLPADTSLLQIPWLCLPAKLSSSLGNSFVKAS